MRDTEIKQIALPTLNAIETNDSGPNNNSDSNGGLKNGIANQEATINHNCNTSDYNTRKE